MAQNLEGKRIAILATDGFEQVELEAPRKALVAEGAETVVVSPKSGEIQGFKHHDKADKVRVDLVLDQAKPETFDGLLLPGGALNPDQLRMDPKAVAFVRSFAAAGKPIAAICHGPWTLVEADVVRDRTLTSWPSLKTDLRNAGAQWLDQEVVQDGNLVTSRKPGDIPAFTAAAIGIFKTGKHTAKA
jgi:protease I